MEEKGEKTNLAGRQAIDKEKSILQGYPKYPASEDIYNKYQEEKDIDPEDISNSKDLNENNKKKSYRERDFIYNNSGRDLDVPGSELDDKQEDIGSEDEENNYYSIGGDGHDNLDEDRGE
jgi:hypothetical protein